MGWFNWGKKKTVEEVISEELIKAQELEAKQLERRAREDKACALEHLRVAERYNDLMLDAKGARKTELQAIVDRRLEFAYNLGFPLNGTISHTINELL